MGWMTPLFYNISRKHVELLVVFGLFAVKHFFHTVLDNASQILKIKGSLQRNYNFGREIYERIHIFWLYSEMDIIFFLIFYPKATEHEGIIYQH